VKAIGSAFSGEGVVTLCHSTGFELLDARPSLIAEDFYDYYLAMADLLIELGKDENDIAVAALNELPRVTAEIGIQGWPQEALERFRVLVEWSCVGKPGLDVSALVGALRRMRIALSKVLDEPEVPLDQRNAFQEHIAELDQLESALEEASFATRLKRWAGRRSYGDLMHESIHDMAPRFEKELGKLAEEASKNASLLNTDLIEWLLSRSSPKADTFFFLLGNSEEGLIFHEQIEALGKRADGANAFSAYWGGWAKRDRRAAEDRLERLARSHAVTGAAIILATGWFEASQAAIDRIRGQIQAGRVDPKYAGRVIMTGQWLKELTEKQFEQLLRSVVGDSLEHGAIAVDMLILWCDYGRSLPGILANFAWQCLAHNPSLESLNDQWNFDQLASRLAENDPEGGFKLFERLLQRSEWDRNHWDPLALGGEYKFWGILHAKDRKRLLRLLLEIARTDMLRQFRLSWRLRELLDQEGDKDLFISFARHSIEYARIIASYITSAKPEFWPIVFELVQMYPDDERLLSNLTAGIEQQGTVVRGPRSQFYAVRQQEIKQILHEPSTPSKVRAWLREVMGRLEREVSRQIIWEYDLNVDELRDHIRDKHSSQRLWAIGRVLKYAAWEDIRRLLTVEDIEDALPYTDLPEQRRKTLEKALEIWRYGK
jgi:hypothetical protein